MDRDLTDSRWEYWFVVKRFEKELANIKSALAELRRYCDPQDLSWSGSNDRDQTGLGSPCQRDGLGWALRVLVTPLGSVEVRLRNEDEAPLGKQAAVQGATLQVLLILAAFAALKGGPASSGALSALIGYDHVHSFYPRVHALREALDTIRKGLGKQLVPKDRKYRLADHLQVVFEVYGNVSRLPEFTWLKRLNELDEMSDAFADRLQSLFVSEKQLNSSLL